MPLKGTAREKKHYERIRKEYPEKGKEYAARVARNIVRANTSEGRKMKGTTEYGRTWGPPYSKSLSKHSMMMPYVLGVKTAFTKLGAKIPIELIEALQKLSPYAKSKALAYGVPALVGGTLGAGTGALAADKGEGGRGALTGALGGALLGLGGAHLGPRAPSALAKLRGAPGAYSPDVSGLILGGPAGMTIGGVGGGLLGERLGRREKSTWEQLKEKLSL